MKYYCKIVDSETGINNRGFFTVSPSRGEIEPGLSEEITVKFSPLEIEENN